MEKTADGEPIVTKQRHELKQYILFIYDHIEGKKDKDSGQNVEIHQHHLNELFQSKLIDLAYLRDYISDPTDAQ